MAASHLQSSSARSGPLARIALAALLALMLGLISAPSRSQEIDHGRVLKRAEQQLMLLEQMGKASILVAMDVNPDEHLQELKRAHSLFNHIRVGLREGNATLGLPPTTNSDILRKLTQVDALWPLFDNTVRRGVESGAVGRTEIDVLAEMNHPLREALDDTMEAYQAEASTQQMHSRRAAAIGVAAEESTLAQRIAKEFMLIAYRHEVRKNRSRLKKSALLFARSLEALQKGDQGQKIIAPPTSSIRRQLEEANSLWHQFKPLIGAAMTGDPPSRDQILQMSELNTELLEVLEEVATLYREL